MKFRYILFVFLLLLLNNTVFAQHDHSSPIQSKVVDQTGTELAGVWISIPAQSLKYQTDENGVFEWNNEQWPAHLDVELSSSETAHIDVNDAHSAHNIIVQRSLQLKEVAITEKSQQEVSTLRTRNIETIGESEFKKAACCRLSESFDNSGAVSVSETDAVTGAKEMEILGLRGIYSLMTFNNIPDFTGLAYPFSLDMIPGTWLNEVAISKGISNAVNGSNGFSGQVNIATKDAFNDEPLFVNMYGNTLGRYEANLHLNKLLNRPGFGIGAYLHGSKNLNSIDQNKDGFLDVPLAQQLNGLLRFTVKQYKNIEGQMDLQFVDDQRTAGQLEDLPGRLYSSNTQAKRFMWGGNIGYVGFDKEGRSVGFKYKYAQDNLTANFGRLNYEGKQNHLYLQGLYEDRFGEGDHIIMAGASMVLDNLDEKYFDTPRVRTERTPGVYVEYSYNPEISNANPAFGKRIGIVASVRSDFNNLYGTQIAPALALKYNFTEDIVLRTNVGKGFRTPYFFTDNLSSFTNGRPIELLDEPMAEEAINYGGSFTLKQKIAARPFSVNIDLYQTIFQNQIIVDMESSPEKVQVYNLRGNSNTTSFLAAINYQLFNGLDAKVAYKWNKNIYDQISGPVEKMMQPRHRMLLALHYTTPNKKWELSSNTHWLSKQEYLVRENTANGLRMIRTEADPYLVLNAQVTTKWKNFDIYVGGENLTNKTQADPIQGWQTPDSNTFDVTQVYAPIVGIRGYIGFRWSPFSNK